MKYFRNIPLLIFAIIAVLMIILAIVDKMFSLGWGMNGSTFYIC